MPKPLKRQIGYTAQKKASKSDKKSVPVAEKSEKQEKISPVKAEPTAKQVVSWLTDHPLFKWAGMCKKVGIDRRNFFVVMKNPEPKIKPETLVKIVSVIKDYGFTY